MNISREEFEKGINEGQELVLGLLANSPDVSVDKFYKVANLLEYINLFSGVIYGVISIAAESSPKQRKANKSNT